MGLRYAPGCYLLPKNISNVPANYVAFVEVFDSKFVLGEVDTRAGKSDMACPQESLNYIAPESAGTAKSTYLSI
jgi:hypothetical protein